PLRPGEVLVRRRHIRPAVHRPAGHALEHHDLALASGRQRGKDEVLAHPWTEVEADGGVVGSRRHPGDVRERERTHRLIERRTVGVALEQAGDVALARGDDDEVARIHVALEIVDGRFVDHETAAARLEMLEPARILYALVDGLARPVDPRREVESLLASNRG